MFNAPFHSRIVTGNKAGNQFSYEKFRKHKGSSYVMSWCFRISLSSRKFPRGFLVSFLTGIPLILYLISLVYSNNYSKISGSSIQYLVDLLTK